MSAPEPPRGALPFLNGVRQLIEGTARITSSLHEHHGSDPVPGSEAAGELAPRNEASLAAPWMERPIYDALGMASLTATAAMDSLHALHRAMGPPWPLAFAPWGIARTALELAARAWWRLEPGIGYRGRVARGMTEKLYAFWETQQLGARLVDGGDAGERIERTVEWARDHDFNVVRVRKPSLWAVEEPRPSSTDVATGLFGDDFGRIAFKVGSQFIHGNVSGLLSRLVATGNDRADVTISNAELANIGFTVVLGYSRMLDRMVRLYGWDLSIWGGWYVHAVRKMNGYFDAIREQR